jgi:hypothetical protein
MKVAVSFPPVHYFSELDCREKVLSRLLHLKILNFAPGLVTLHPPPSG